jgi:hypothetical protein
VATKWLLECGCNPVQVRARELRLPPEEQEGQTAVSDIGVSEVVAEVGGLSTEPHFRAFVGVAIARDENVLGVRVSLAKIANYR